MAWPHGPGLFHSGYTMYVIKAGKYCMPGRLGVSKIAMENLAI